MDAYLDKLGIVQKAKADLDRLDAAMSNKYLKEELGADPNGDATISTKSDKVNESHGPPADVENGFFGSFKC